MTATEMEDLLKNLDLRSARIEQILPTLATKDDLKALDLRTTRIEQILPTLATKEDLKAFATKEDLNAGIADAKRHATVLFEDLRSDIRLLAEHVADILQRLPPRR